MDSDSGGGAKGSVAASDSLDAVVIHKDGSTTQTQLTGVKKIIAWFKGWFTS